MNSELSFDIKFVIGISLDDENLNIKMSILILQMWRKRKMKYIHLKKHEELEDIRKVKM